MKQLLLGSGIICLTVIIQVFFIAAASHRMARRSNWLLTPPVIPKVMAALSACVLWLVLGVGIIAGIWAVVFIGLGLFQTLESAIYFSIVAFTTLGFGDITLGESWRLLSGFTAVSGLIVFGLNTAYLVSFLSQLNKPPEQLTSDPPKSGGL